MKQIILQTAYKKKVGAKLNKAKAKLDALEALAKEKKAQAVIDTIVALRSEKKAITARMGDFEDADETNFSKFKANIEKQVGALNAAVSKLSVKLKEKSQSAESR